MLPVRLFLKVWEQEQMYGVRSWKWQAVAKFGYPPVEGIRVPVCFHAHLDSRHPMLGFCVFVESIRLSKYRVCVVLGIDGVFCLAQYL